MSETQSGITREEFERIFNIQPSKPRPPEGRKLCYGSIRDITPHNFRLFYGWSRKGFGAFGRVKGALVCQVHITHEGKVHIFNLKGKTYKTPVSDAMQLSLQTFRPSQGKNILLVQWDRENDMLHIFDFVEFEHEPLYGTTYRQRYERIKLLRRLGSHFRFSFVFHHIDEIKKLSRDACWKDDCTFDSFYLYDSSFLYHCRSPLLGEFQSKHL